MAAAKPRVVVPGRLWEVHAGLPMEAFWCAHSPECVTLYNFNMPTGTRQPTRKGKPLATVLCYHARSRTAAGTLQLTEAGEAQHNDTIVWAETYACKGDGNCLKRRGKCSVKVHITATRKQASAVLPCTADPVVMNLGSLGLQGTACIRCSTAAVPLSRASCFAAPVAVLSVPFAPC